MGGGISIRELRLQRGISYKVREKEYFEVAKILDGLGGVRKDILNGFIIYSPAWPDPDLKLRAIKAGTIIIDNSQRTVDTSSDLQLETSVDFKGNKYNLQDKLAELILGWGRKLIWLK